MKHQDNTECIPGPQKMSIQTRKPKDQAVLQPSLRIEQVALLRTKMAAKLNPKTVRRMENLKTKMLRRRRTMKWMAKEEENDDDLDDNDLQNEVSFHHEVMN